MVWVNPPKKEKLHRISLILMPIAIFFNVAGLVFDIQSSVGKIAFIVDFFGQYIPWQVGVIVGAIGMGVLIYVVYLMVEYHKKIMFAKSDNQRDLKDIALSVIAILFGIVWFL